MKTALVLGGIILGLLTLGGCFAVNAFLKGTTWHPDLRKKQLDRRVSVDLSGLATMELPPTFRLVGMADTDTGRGAAEGTTTPEFSHDERRAVFRFEQGNMNDWGGHRREPVLLNVILLNPALPPDDPEDLSGFSIARYYSPIGGETVDQTAPPWEQAEEGALRWRWLAMNDVFSADHEPRWAIILLNVETRTRLDFFAWQKEYKLEAARDLLRSLEKSLRPAPALASHFTRTGTFEERMDARREANLAAAERALTAAGGPSFVPGEIAFSDRFAAWLDSDRKAVRIARYLGSVSLDEVPRESAARPMIPLDLRLVPEHEGGEAKYEPDLPLTILYWDEGTEQWRTTNLRRRTGDEHLEPHSFLLGLTTRLTEKHAAHLFAMGFYYHPPALDELSEVPELIATADSFQTELIEGRLARVPAQAASFRR